MLISTLTECEVFNLVQKRYNWKPKEVEKFANRVQFNINNTSNQNINYYWRPGDQAVSQGAPINKIDFPLFIGEMELSIINEDPVFTNVANGYVLISQPVVDKLQVIAGSYFYNWVGELLRAYGIGTYTGATFPVYGIAEYLGAGNNGGFFMAPFLNVDLLTDATGAVSLTIYASFNGFRVYMV